MNNYNKFKNRMKIQKFIKVRQVSYNNNNNIRMVNLLKFHLKKTKKLVETKNNL